MAPRALLASRAANGVTGRAAGLARFLHLVGRLKFTPRTGWLDRAVPPVETESVADHSYRLALLTWLAAASQPELDRAKVLKLALVHDLAEAITGDSPPYDPTQIPAEADPGARHAFLSNRHIRSEATKNAKRASEAAAMAELLADLPAPLAEELAALWREAAAQTSPEARFVKQADALEAYFQSREYLAAEPSRPMASFAAEVAEVITEPALVALRDAVDDLKLGST